ncbi:MAG: GNAT family N-acetyltransferase [Rikenellaceae bacterium]
MQQPIIAPIERELLKKELRDELFLRNTNKAGNLLYVFHADEAPMLMREVGRLREEAFRDAGGGTGQEIDIDEADLDPEGYKQLIVWDPSQEEILGGYRYIIPRSSNPKCLSTEHYFEFSKKFRNKYLPYTMELGRSFVQTKYQQQGSLKALFALDNLWDGLGTIVSRNADIRYLFGKVTMYGDYNVQARNMLIYFLRMYFPDRDNLMRTIYPAEINIDEKQMKEIFTGGDYMSNYKILSRCVRNFEEVIPPLINAYMSLSPTMRVFETAINHDFGNVEETGILITIGDLYKEKVARHFEIEL